MVPECGLNENQTYSIILGENLLTLQIAGLGGKDVGRGKKNIQNISICTEHTRAGNSALRMSGRR